MALQKPCLKGHTTACGLSIFTAAVAAFLLGRRTALALHCASEGASSILIFLDAGLAFLTLRTGASICASAIFGKMSWFPDRNFFVYKFVDGAKRNK